MATNVSLLQNIAPGQSSSSPSDLTAFNGAVYFTARNDTTGRELWKSDGTTTTLVKDINPGADDSFATGLTVFNNALYFTAYDSTNGTRLWKTDGTATSLVSNVPPGGNSGLTVFQGALYFSFFNSTNGYELWKTDGTTSTLIKDIYPGDDSFFPSQLKAVGNTLYFTAYTAETGTELWKTDGTTTTLVKDIRPGELGSSGADSNFYASEMAAVGNTLYFTANGGMTGTELWKTDGTTTTLVKDIRPGELGSSGADAGFYASEMVAVGNTLYFTANDGTTGAELWKTDGTTTTLVKDIRLGENGSNPYNLTAVGNTLYFSASDVLNGYELWKTDGTTTTLVKDIYSGDDSSFPDELTAIGNTLYFTASDAANGRELWKTDGTATTLVKDIRLGEESSEPFNLTAIGNTLYFSATDLANGTELWKFTPNTIPLVSNVTKTGGENGKSQSFSSIDFASRFTDADGGDALTKIKVTALPTNGILSIGTTAVTLNQELTTAQLASLVYSPKAGFIGADSFSWNGFDGEEYAKADATVSLTVNAPAYKDLKGTAKANKLKGSNLSDRITGKGGDDQLVGGAGNDLLIGGRGNDLLTGGKGNDRFYLGSPKDSVDFITDFSLTDDLIVLKGSKFGGLTAGAFSADQFQIGTAAQDSDDRFIYSISTGKLFFDADGKGGAKAIELAQFNPGNALTAQSFAII